MTETRAYGYSSESTQGELSNIYHYVLNGFKKSLHPCTLDESSLSIGRVNPFAGEFGQYDMLTKRGEINKSLAHGYPFESTQQELSNENQHDRV